MLLVLCIRYYDVNLFCCEEGHHMCGMLLNKLRCIFGMVLELILAKLELNCVLFVTIRVVFSFSLKGFIFSIFCGIYGKCELLISFDRFEPELFEKIDPNLESDSKGTNSEIKPF